MRPVKLPAFGVGKGIGAVRFWTVDVQSMEFPVVGLHRVAIVARGMTILGHASVVLTMVSPVMRFAFGGVGKGLGAVIEEAAALPSMIVIVAFHDIARVEGSTGMTVAVWVLAPILSLRHVRGMSGR